MVLIPFPKRHQVEKDGAIDRSGSDRRQEDRRSDRNNVHNFREEADRRAENRRQMSRREEDFQDQELRDIESTHGGMGIDTGWAGVLATDPGEGPAPAADRSWAGDDAPLPLDEPFSWTDD